MGKPNHPLYLPTMVPQFGLANPRRPQQQPSICAKPRRPLPLSSRPARITWGRNSQGPTLRRRFGGYFGKEGLGFRAPHPSVDWVISRNSHVESAPSARTVQERSFNTIHLGIRAIGVLWGGIFLVSSLLLSVVVVAAAAVVVGVPPPLKAHTLLKTDFHGKGGGGGSSVLRKLIREATTRGMCVLESIGIIALGVFGQCYAGSSSTGSTFQWQAPRRGDT